MPKNSLSAYIKRFFFQHKYGILGTVIFHLLLGILFLSVGIAGMKMPERIEIEYISLPDVEKIKVIEEKEKIDEERKEALKEEVQNMLRAVATNENISQESRPSSENVNEYIERLRNELSQNDYDGRYQIQKDETYIQDSLQVAADRQEQILDSLKSTFYSGESSVSYNLENRYARILPIPVFRCEFGGKVVVQIRVSRNGSVQRAEVIDSLSDSDECIREVAVDAALRSRFNEKPDASTLQQGTITYNFVKQ